MDVDQRSAPLGGAGGSLGTPKLTSPWPSRNRYASEATPSSTPSRPVQAGSAAGQEGANISGRRAATDPVAPTKGSPTLCWHQHCLCVRPLTPSPPCGPPHSGVIMNGTPRRSGSRCWQQHTPLQSFSSSLTVQLLLHRSSMAALRHRAPRNQRRRGQPQSTAPAASAVSRPLQASLDGRNVHTVEQTALQRGAACRPGRQQHACTHARSQGAASCVLTGPSRTPPRVLERGPTPPWSAPMATRKEAAPLHLPLTPPPASPGPAARAAGSAPLWRWQRRRRRAWRPAQCLSRCCCSGCPWLGRHACLMCGARGHQGRALTGSMGCRTLTEMTAARSQIGDRRPLLKPAGAATPSAHPRATLLPDGGRVRQHDRTPRSNPVSDRVPHPSRLCMSASPPPLPQALDHPRLCGWQRGLAAWLGVAVPTNAVALGSGRVTWAAAGVTTAAAACAVVRRPSRPGAR